jgi:transcriptional regulator with XRE-family HTH domain
LYAEAMGRDESTIEAVATALKRIRSRMGMTVEDLSKRAGVSAGVISQLERGIGNPSLLTLSRLAHGLSVELSQILDLENGDSPPLVTKQSRKKLDPIDKESEAAGLERELITPSLSTSLQLIETRMPVGFSNEQRPFRRLGTECVLVVSGEVKIHHGEESYELNTGDALTYDCTKTHWWENIGKTEAVVLGAATPFGD